MYKRIFKSFRVATIPVIAVMVFNFASAHIVHATVDQNNVKSVVSVWNYDEATKKYVSSGSGVVIDGWNILTNYHVVSDAIKSPTKYRVVICTSVLINNLPDCNYVASPFGLLGNEAARYSQELDLAILTFTGKFVGTSLKSFWQWTGTDFPDVGKIKLGDYGTDPKVFKFEKGSSVEALGYPSDSNGRLSYSKGAITGFDFNSYKDLVRVRISAKIYFGSSGGGAFDSNGKFLGVTSGGWTDADGRFIEGYIIPVTTVNWWIQSTQGYRQNKNGEYTILDQKTEQAMDEALCILGNTQYCKSGQAAPPLVHGNDGLQDCLKDYSKCNIEKPGSAGNNSVQPSDIHPVGTILFADDWKTVYVMGNGVRRGFATPEEFQSHGYKFSEIIKGNSSDYVLPEGSVIPFADGTLVLDTSDGKTVYIVNAGSKRGFTAPEVFTGLGYQFSQAVKGNLSTYPAGLPIGSSTEAHPEGALINVQNTVYKVGSGGKQVFPDQKVFDSWSYSFARVVLANSADVALPTLAPIKFRDGTILKRNSNSDTAYLVSEGKLRPFSSSVALLNFGYDFGDSVNVTDADIAGYEMGSAVK